MIGLGCTAIARLLHSIAHIGTVAAISRIIGRLGVLMLAISHHLRVVLAVLGLLVLVVLVVVVVLAPVAASIAVLLVAAVLVLGVAGVRARLYA